MSDLHLRLRDSALAAARVGGRAALAHFRDPALATEWKRDASPVTVADRACEQAIRAHLLAAWPDDAWLGEETGADEGGGSGRRWIVDPIDGTRNFVRGVPLWATLVACEEEMLDGSRRVVAAAAGFPALNEWYDAALGHGARCEGRPIAVSTIARLDQSLWCYETPAWFRNHGLSDTFEALCSSTALQRGLCDAYGHILVATGRAEVVVEPHLSTWDVAATSLIVREAGGAFSDLDGHDNIRAGNAVVTNGHLHDTLLELIRRTRR
jgi:histidinol phosphatase-like enzyme (inositol monophosphatase family)